jgi:hypothetical protein
MRRIAYALIALATVGAAAVPAEASRRDGNDIVYFWENAAMPGAGFGWSDQPRPSVFGSVRPTSVRMACELAVGRTMRRDNSGLTQAMLQVDACMRRGGV